MNACRRELLVVFGGVALGVMSGTTPATPTCTKGITANIVVDQGHPWRPPFGIERVGALPVVRAEVTDTWQVDRDYWVIARRNGHETERRALRFQANSAAYAAKDQPGKPTARFAHAQLSGIPEEVVLYAQCAGERQPRVLGGRKSVKWPQLEIEANARAERATHPVDLGAILVPHDWLLLSPGDTAVIRAASVSHQADQPSARLRAWFEGGQPVEVAMPMTRGERVSRELRVPVLSVSDRQVLHVSLTDGRKVVWNKNISTMLAIRAAPVPRFGAVETKLRYDAPIIVKERQGGGSSKIDYDTAWDPALKDVVVFLPNGSRFVFWRGSNYIPFWAGAHNTGLTYEWAENHSQPVHHPDGTVDFPEPLFDTELRYGRVRVVESTRSRVHVRWAYQSTDIDYNVWGDQATEDFYFYPDGFGTRVLSLTSAPGANYEISEFIVITPRAAYPLEVLPSHIVDVLYLDGRKSAIKLPLPVGEDSRVPNPSHVPMIYRVYFHKEDPASAIYFSPRDTTTPSLIFPPFHDRGELVTPAYWGSHWPLGRNTWTGAAIDDRIHSSPSHNSLMSWIEDNRPKPLSVEEFPMMDTVGRARTMQVQRWAWLIAKTDESDESLLRWAHSFSDPPTVQVKGARIDFPSYSPERRAIRLIAESNTIEITLKPQKHTVNPVFEIDAAAGPLEEVHVGGKALPKDDYAWDGRTLWTRALIADGAETLTFQFR